MTLAMWKLSPNIRVRIMNQDCIIQCTMYVTKNESEMRGLCQLQNKICNLRRPNKTKEIRKHTCMTVKLFRNLNILSEGCL